MSLQDVFCQDRAIGILQRGLAAGKSAHAYIFAGPEGVGKYRTAREWARLLLCKSPKSGPGGSGPFADSCGSCESCVLLCADSHADYAHVYKELLEFTENGKDRKTPLDMPIVSSASFSSSGFEPAVAVGATSLRRQRAEG
jgi:DNA polymerase-3 subunit delta'